jgi:membrane-associated phospholipid phosphatase
MVNDNHTPFGDLVFPYITWLGDGWFYAIFAVVFLVLNWRLGIFLGISGGLLSATSQFLKKVVFADYPRPKKFFEGEEVLNFIEGVRVASNHAFPSGHTMTAFVIATFLAMLYPRSKSIHVAIIMLASLAAFSRIYLLQHFYRDVYAGAIIGTFLALVLWFTIKPLIVRPS